jgi:hypothetical protein
MFEGLYACGRVGGNQSYDGALALAIARSFVKILVIDFPSLD